MNEQKKNNLTREEIFEICDRLLERNVTPTNKGVREAAGNRGSNSTIQRYRSEWFTENKDRIKIEILANLSRNQSSFRITPEMDKLAKDAFASIYVEVEQNLTLENQRYLQDDNDRLRDELEEEKMNYKSLQDRFEGYKLAQEERIDSIEKKYQEQIEKLNKRIEELEASMKAVNNKK